MNYLDLIEEYNKKTGLSQFEKVMVLAQRAKDIYAGKAPTIEKLETRKPTAIAQYESANDKLEPVVSEKLPNETIDDDMENED